MENLYFFLDIGWGSKNPLK